MDPITLAALAGTAISSVIGGSQTDKANKRNADIAMLNYYQQQAAQRDAIAESRRQQSEAHMGTTDAAGNRTYFVPGQGWVTELSDRQQQLQGLTEDEQLRQLVEGAGRAERVDARANEQRNDEAIMAEAAMEELRGVRPTDKGALRELFLARGAEQRNKQADQIGGQVARQAIRAGGGGNAAELLQRGRGIADQEAARTAGIDATLQAEQESERQFDHNRDRASQLYDYFRRASTTGAQAPQGFMPTGPQRGSTGVADQGIINAMGRAAQRDYEAPNLALTDTIGDVSSVLGAYGNMRKNDALLDAFMRRSGMNTGAIS